MDERTCFFIGHREASRELFPALETSIQRHIVQYGVETFVVGGYGGFDRLVSEVLIAAKQRHPHICLLRLIPYHPVERSVEPPKGFDGTFYPPDMEYVPRRVAIIKANHYMVDHAKYLIAYVWHSDGNARALVEYAQKRQVRGLIRVENLADNK